MRDTVKRPVVVAAGGTGGHVFPAEALVSVLLERGHRVVVFTDRRSGVLRSAVFSGCETDILPVSGIAGRGLRRGVMGALSLGAASWRVRARLAALRPAAVVGFGGYPSVAPMLAASLIAPRPFRVLHEQNAVLGRANRLLARFADMLALGFAETARVPDGVEAVVTGNPVRPAIAAVPEWAPAADGALRLLVLGGSLGARALSRAVPEAVIALPEALRARVSVTQQCREEDLAGVRAAYAANGVQAELAPFFSDVPALLAAADLVISRAGASSCAELACAGRPAVLVPLPSAIDDHQRANARALAETGGAVIVDESEASRVLPDLLASLLGDADRRGAMAAAARGAARPDAAVSLADLVERNMRAETNS